MLRACATPAIYTINRLISIDYVYSQPTEFLFYSTLNERSCLNVDTIGEVFVLFCGPFDSLVSKFHDKWQCCIIAPTTSCPLDVNSDALTGVELMRYS